MPAGMLEANAGVQSYVSYSKIGADGTITTIFRRKVTLPFYFLKMILSRSRGLQIYADINIFKLGDVIFIFSPKF